MNTVILDIDIDFENADTLDKHGKKQDVMKTLAKYHAALVKAASVINLLQTNICEDEVNDLELFVDDNEKLCVRASSELAERFVCFGIADYDEYSCDSEEDESEDNDDSEDSEDSDDEEDGDTNEDEDEDEDEDDENIKMNDIESESDDTN